MLKKTKKENGGESARTVRTQWGECAGTVKPGGFSTERKKKQNLAEEKGICSNARKSLKKALNGAQQGPGILLLGGG